jgi:hypothetical protein
VAHPQIAVFARLANNNTAPVRKIEGQKTFLARTMHAIAYDPIHDEIVVPQIFAQGILTFRGAINGEESPIRYIQGPLTKLQDPDHAEVDPVHNEILVAQHGHVLVFPREGNGNVAPLREIAGPDTQMGPGDQGVRVDPVHNLIIVSDYSTKGGSKILMFDRMADGNAKPVRVISGPKSGLTEHPVGIAFAVYPAKNEIIIGVGKKNENLSGVHGTSEVRTTIDRSSYIGVWNINDDGDVPPRWTIGGPGGAFVDLYGVTIDPKHKEVIATDGWQESVMTFSFPEIF